MGIDEEYDWQEQEICDDETLSEAEKKRVLSELRRDRVYEEFGF